MPLRAWFGLSFPQTGQAPKAKLLTFCCTPNTGNICPHMQIFTSSFVCYLKFYIQRKSLSASFIQETCQTSIHQITVGVFLGQARKRNISLGGLLYMQLPGRGFFTADPGEQIMTNEVQVNVTRGGSWRGTGLCLNLYREISPPGQTEGQTHRKCITSDAGQSRPPQMSSSDL